MVCRHLFEDWGSRWQPLTSGLVHEAWMHRNFIFARSKVVRLLDGFSMGFGKVVGGELWLGCQSYQGMMSGQERVATTDWAPQN